MKRMFARYPETVQYEDHALGSKNSQHEGVRFGYVAAAPRSTNRPKAGCVQTPQCLLYAAMNRVPSLEMGKSRYLFESHLSVAVKQISRNTTMGLKNCGPLFLSQL